MQKKIHKPILVAALATLATLPILTNANAAPVKNRVVVRNNIVHTTNRYPNRTVSQTRRTIVRYPAARSNRTPTRTIVRNNTTNRTIYRNRPVYRTRYYPVRRYYSTPRYYTAPRVYVTPRYYTAPRTYSTTRYYSNSGSSYANNSAGRLTDTEFFNSKTDALNLFNSAKRDGHPATLRWNPSYNRWVVKVYSPR